MNKLQSRLAEILTIRSLEKGGPFGGSAAVGTLDGFPVAASWTKVAKRAAVGYLIRFRKGSLQAPPDLLKDQIASSPELLRALGVKKISGADRKSMAVDDSALVFFQSFSFRPPKPEAVASALRALLALVKDRAKPIDAACEKCERSGGEIYCVDGIPMRVCAGCREQMDEEDRRRIEAYVTLPSNPMMGTLAGVLTAAVMALVWGGLAFALERIFLYGAILIGIAVAWAVNKGMGKINTYGRALTVVLTPLAVLAGDYFFYVLATAKQLQQPADARVAGVIAEHFLELEFSESTGYISLLFGLIGAGYILYVNRPPTQRRSMTPVEAAAQ